VAKIYRQVNSQQLLEHLKNVALFSHLPKKYLELIQSNFREITLPKGSIILQQKEQTFDLHILLWGTVKVTLINSAGKEVVLDILREGDFFGELSFLDHKPRSATVTAITDVKMLVLAKEVFLRILQENPDISINLLSGLAKRLRKANETIETLTFLDVSGRVAKILIDMANETGEQLKDGFVKIQCPTHQYIANQIGASREAVTKAIKSLRSKGLILMAGKEIMIAPKQFEIF
jgi:CRP/FNR family transcriptional regulator/CRP/FNR family cyclic AMP-dependent transcriptional regulator